jgi:hypothetical protein
VFELTEMQAAAFGLKPGLVRWGPGRSPEVQGVPDPPVTITNLEIVGCDALPADHPIVADVSFDTSGLAIGPCVFRLDYEVPGLRTSAGWFYFDGLLRGSGRIRCQFMAVQKPGTLMAACPPIAMFPRVCTVPDPKNTENRKPVSNIAAALVTIKAGR